MEPTGPVAPGRTSEWRIGNVKIAGHVLPMKQISFGEALAAQAEGDEEPFWAHVWPVGRLLATRVFEGPDLHGRRCLDLGTGSGIVGIALGLKGADVTFADLSPESLELAAENAKRCGVAKFETLLLDWREPPARRFDEVYAADVAYDHLQVDALAESFDRLLEPGGTGWIADPRRPNFDRFVGALASRGFDVETVLDEPERVILRIRRR